MRQRGPIGLLIEMGFAPVEIIPEFNDYVGAQVLGGGQSDDSSYFYGEATASCDGHISRGTVHG